MGFEYRLFTPAPHVSILHPTHPYIHTHITSDAFCTLVLQCVAMLLHACVAVCCNASNMTLHASYTHLAPHARMQTHPSYTTHTHTVAYTPTHSPIHPRTPPSGWVSCSRRFPWRGQQALWSKRTTKGRAQVVYVRTRCQ